MTFHPNRDQTSNRLPAGAKMLGLCALAFAISVGLSGCLAPADPKKQSIKEKKARNAGLKLLGTWGNGPNEHRLGGEGGEGGGGAH